MEFVQPAAPVLIREAGAAPVRTSAFLPLVGGLVALGPTPAAAQAAAPAIDPPVPVAKQAPAASSEPANLWERGTLFGDRGGVRNVLDGLGISLSLTETDEVLGNPTGGRAQGIIYEGLAEVSLNVDTGKAFGLAGGTLYASALQIHGRGLSTNDIDNWNVASNIEADRAARLFELWYQQSLLDGRMDVKLGQQSADLEFITTQYGGIFINASFGWPTLPAIDLPSGGVAYPLATPGVRLRVRPSDDLAVLVGVFDGSPAGLGNGDPQLLDPSGTNFDMRSGVFAIGEVQYAAGQGEAAKALPGTYKFGVWYNSNAFADPFFAAAPAPGGPFSHPRALRNDWSVYAVADQLVFRPAGSKDAWLGVFARAMGAPGDRNQVGVFVDGGVTYKGGFGRDGDSMGIGVGWARISDSARAGDAAFAAVSGAPHPIRSSETVLELTYQAQVAPWWAVQPDIQYVFEPGGGIADPAHPSRRIGDAAIAGVRSTITF
jgi:porin